LKAARVRSAGVAAVAITLIVDQMAGRVRLRLWSRMRIGREK
jgi:hypothetical protein